MRATPGLGLALLLSACARTEPEAPPANAVSAQAPDPTSVPEPLSPGTSVEPASNPALAPPPPAATTPALAVEGEGLRLFARDTGRARPIPFGTPRAEVERALAFRGPPGTGTQADCGAGPLAYAAWPDGLKLYYQGGKFTGWALDARAAGPRGPAIGTAAGVGPGATRTQLTEASVATFEKTSLGTEFRSGEISGLLDGAAAGAKITDMWAGANCVFR